mgnify:CR=1 FL=1
MVAPFAGARIETRLLRRRDTFRRASLPSRERGSKRGARDQAGDVGRVAPFAGARIETSSTWLYLSVVSSRSLRGSADRNLGCIAHREGLFESLPSRERGSKRLKNRAGR